MIPALGRFVEALRGEGVAASPAEVLDAVQAVEAVGLEDRRRFRAALRATLAKDVRQAAVFDALFDRFFVPPARSSARKGERGRGAGDLGPRRTGTGERVPSGRPVPRDRPGTRHPDPGERRGARRQRAADEESRRRVREAIEASRPGSTGRRGRLRLACTDKPGRAGASPDPMKTDLARPMPTEEERDLARRVPRILDALRLGKARRLERARGGRLWVRRVFRQSLSHGGVPFVLPYRRPKRRKARVVLLVDVSYSTARAAGYFLWMALSFLEAGRRARAVLFVDRPVDATLLLARWARRNWGASAGARSPAARVPAAASAGRRGRRPGEGIAPAGSSFASLLESLPGLNLDAPSDYGRALHALLRSHLRPAGSDTVLAILGDGRTNRFDPLPWALEEISRRCRAVIWLVPEPEARWGTGDSALGSYLPFVDVVAEAKDLAGLARGLAEVLRRV